MLKPLFVTGVRCMNIETERAWHARQLVSELTLQELNSYDGIVAVIMRLHCLLSCSSTHHMCREAS